MRQIATLPEEPAEKFIDYLATLSIAARSLPEPGGAAFGVWVCDEDRVDQARQELQQFLGAPGDARYDHASAGRIRHGTRFLRFREDKEPRECRFEDLDEGG